MFSGCACLRTRTNALHRESARTPSLHAPSCHGCSALDRNSENVHSPDTVAHTCSVPVPM
jgi:hypothetical protein